jgi:predicted RNA binding protein YcfA (HicA-like mRNA interferase family)
MKRRALLKYLQDHGCELLREGDRHSVYWNPANRRVSTVPRHNEVEDRLAAKICKDLGIPRPGFEPSG